MDPGTLAGVTGGTVGAGLRRRR
ncbi:PEP-CTERM sorting domain-containing protein [Sphingomonas sp. UNC305MFCol5.2]